MILRLATANENVGAGLLTGPVIEVALTLPRRYCISFRNRPEPEARAHRTHLCIAIFIGDTKTQRMPHA